MTSIMNHLIGVGFGVAMQVAGVPVTYQRGSHSLSFNAVPTEERYTVPDEQGILSEIHSRDYLVEAVKLAKGGTVFEPRAGDRIKEQIEGQWLTFEVFPVDRQRCFRYRDAGRQLLRIHTKRVA